MKIFTKKFILFFSIFTIITTTAFITYNIYLSKNQYIELSKKMLNQEALSHYKNMTHTRSWNSRYEGVYVKAKKGQKPNPYLQNNHIFTKDDELLIKINPAWMTRQISEISNERGDYYYSITSLNPINPNNSTDAFEKEALHYFKKNSKEKYYTKLESDYFNFMGALETTPSCLKCHPNYNLGEIRGGLRVSIPTTTFNKNIVLLESKTTLFLIITYLIGFLILIMVVYFINNIFKRQETIEQLNSNLEIKIQKRTKELEENVKKLNELATIDFLTNIPNRRYFFNISSKIFSLSQRDQTNLSLLLIDIDFFKQINDKHGHLIGDEVLKLVALKISNNIRNSDILARIGGEEFAILLNKTDKKNAFILAEKIRIIIEKTIYEYEDININVTISTGISEIKDEDKDINCMIQRADDALYNCKTNGRNCSIIS